MQNTMINGIEVKVGQKWKDRANRVFEITGVMQGAGWPIRSHSLSWTERGEFYSGSDSDYDIVELVQDIEQTKAKARVVEEITNGVINYMLEVLQENGQYEVRLRSDNKEYLIEKANTYATTLHKVIHEVF